MRNIFVLGLTLFMAACVVHRLEVTPVEVADGTPTVIETPVKAHLNDGSTVVFADGMTVSGDSIFGDGVSYDLTLENSQDVAEIALGDVAAMESYQSPVSTGATTVASAGTTLGIVAVTTLAALALFGSCPTVYSLEPDGSRLEAELFSYSIAPTFQSRDVDRLGAGALTDGLLSLEVRNEMLETHYIDHLEVLEVTHLPGQRVYPDEKGRPIVARNFIAPSLAVDNEGRDVLTTVRDADGDAWQASSERLASVTSDDRIDHVDLEFEVPPGTGAPALVLRMRNSLLNTVLLYDVMLNDQGFGALDWLGKDVNRIDRKIRTGLWYRRHMGLDISVWKSGRYHKVARVGDQGPIAWSERAVQLPSGHNGKLKVRLSFVADNWRFDQVMLGLGAETSKTRVVPVASAETRDGDRPDIPDFLARTDKQYLVTRPQDSVRVSFDVGSTEDDRERTYFLVSSGYYMEWMRSEWLQDSLTTSFVPNEKSLMRAISIYSDKREGLRHQFESTRIEVR